MTREAIRNDLLSYGLEDILGLWWIIGVVAQRIGTDPHDQQRLITPTLDAIHDLIAAGYAVAGDVAKNDQGVLYIQPWGMSPSEVVDRIERKWRELTEPPNLGDVVWLELTEKGKAEARNLS